MPDTPDDVIQRREWNAFVALGEQRHEEELRWRERQVARLDDYLRRDEYERILRSENDERDLARVARVERQQAHALEHGVHAKAHDDLHATNREAVEAARRGHDDVHTAQDRARLETASELERAIQTVAKTTLEAASSHEKLHAAHENAHNREHSSHLISHQERDANNQAAINRTEVNVRETAAIHAKAHEREHQLAQLAIDEAKDSNTNKFEQLNGAAARSRDERSVYATRDQVEDKTSALAARLGVLDTQVASLAGLTAQAVSNAARIEALERANATLQGRDRGVSTTVAAIVTGLTVLVMLLGFFAVKGGI